MCLVGRSVEADLHADAGGHTTRFGRLATLKRTQPRLWSPIEGQVKVTFSTARFLLCVVAGASLEGQVIGPANGDGDTINSIKQAAEFSIVPRGQKLVRSLVCINDVDGLGREVAQGRRLTNAITETGTTRSVHRRRTTLKPSRPQVPTRPVKKCNQHRSSPIAKRGLMRRLRSNAVVRPCDPLARAVGRALRTRVLPIPRRRSTFDASPTRRTDSPTMPDPEPIGRTASPSASASTPHIYR
jgi:hypothetical protein